MNLTIFYACVRLQMDFNSCISVKFVLLVTRIDENGVASRLFLGICSTRGETYYFRVEGSKRDEIEMNLRNGRWGGGGIETNIRKLRNSEGWRQY